MREWNLKTGDPLSLTLAADARLGRTDYVNDQIWELSLEGGEPPALAVQTTYGLRARNLRMFPRFSEGDQTLNDPATFASPPAVRYFYPNFLLVTFSPFPDVESVAEYWVPTSQVIAGRVSLTNLSGNARKIRLEWAALLNPVGEGKRMAPTQIAAVTVLSGQSGDLEPVLFLTGGPQAGTGPFPTLAINLDLAAGESRQVIWACAALPSEAASFELARQTAARNWDAERMRLQLLNSGQIEIHTGEPDWDAAFSLSQKVAFSLFVGPTDHLPFPSFVLTRTPDQGFSLRGDGGDYNHLWNGQTPLDAYYLTSLILPTAPSLAQGLLRNFLAAAREDGFVDWRPGLGGQRSQLLATPLLASLAEKIYQATSDRAFLEEVFTPLIEFFHAWFAPQHDRDVDAIPEWDHPMQTGFDDHPLFAHWYPWSQGADISTAETPSLCAFLYRECQALIRFARLLGHEEVIVSLVNMAENLRNAVETSWKAEDAIYQNLDRDSHYCTKSELLGERLGAGEVGIDRDFEHPVRMLIRIQIKGETTRRPHIFVHGTNLSGQHLVESIMYDQFQWYMGRATATGERVYTHLERILIQGLDIEDTVSLHSVGYACQDHTLLLPLWAGIPAPERAQAIIEKTLTSSERFWRAYGIPACIDSPASQDEPICHYVHLPWNYLIGEGILSYGYRKEAAELVSRLMSAITKSLSQEGAFRRNYHAESGQGQGERNSHSGLAPLGLFLDTLGVRLISPKEVALSGLNPYPWPVTVKYRGLTIFRQIDKTIVIFPDGEAITVKDPEPCVVSLE